MLLKKKFLTLTQNIQSHKAITEMFIKTFENPHVIKSSKTNKKPLALLSN